MAKLRLKHPAALSSHSAAQDNLPAHLAIVLTAAGTGWVRDDDSIPRPLCQQGAELLLKSKAGQPDSGPAVAWFLLPLAQGNICPSHWTGSNISSRLPPGMEGRWRWRLHHPALRLLSHDSLKNCSATWSSLPDCAFLGFLFLSPQPFCNFSRCKVDCTLMVVEINNKGKVVKMPLWQRNKVCTFLLTCLLLEQN